MKFAKIRIVNILIVFDSANKNYVKKNFSPLFDEKKTNTFIQLHIFIIFV